MTAIQPYLKAVVGFLAPGLLILGNALVQGDPITAELALKALGTALVAGLAVYAVPNRDPNGERQDESVQPPEKPQEYRAKHRDEPPGPTEMSLRRSSVVRIDYTYATKHDRTFFAEDASNAPAAVEGEATTVAPPRTVGATITFLHPVTKATVGTLTTGASGWIDGTLTVPRALAVTADGEVPIYSHEWIKVRGRGRRPVAHSGPDSTPVELLLPGDWSVTAGARVIWDGSAWIRETTSPTA